MSHVLKWCLVLELRWHHGSFLGLWRIGPRTHIIIVIIVEILLANEVGGPFMLVWSSILFKLGKWREMSSRVTYEVVSLQDFSDITG